MRANILINRNGITQPSVNATPPNGGASVKHNNKTLIVTISANPSARALSALVRTLSAVETEMELHGAGGYNHGHYKRPRFCILLSQMALDQRELKTAPQSISKIEILSGALMDIDVLPEDLFQLRQLSLGTLDVPTALQRISEVGIKNLVSVGQTMSMKLSFIARPDNLIWPSQTPKLGETFEEYLPRAEGEWLATVYVAALAIRRPLYHHGLITIDTKGRQPFQRLIYPLAPAHERSINHRVLSVATLNNHPNCQMI